MNYADPELWQPGDLREIPRLFGNSHWCTILRVQPSIIEFYGPTGRASITRELYGKLSEGATA